MELLRTISHPPGGGGAKYCEAAAGRAAGGESRRKKAEEPLQQHGHPSAEVSRIITDPTTGKRYCRGKVLGKVMATAGVPSSPRSPAGRALPLRGCVPRRAERAAPLPLPRNRALGSGEPAGATWMLHAGSGEREPSDRR